MLWGGFGRCFDSFGYVVVLFVSLLARCCIVVYGVGFCGVLCVLNDVKYVFLVGFVNWILGWWVCDCVCLVLRLFNNGLLSVAVF